MSATPYSALLARIANALETIALRMPVQAHEPTPPGRAALEPTEDPFLCDLHAEDLRHLAACPTRLRCSACESRYCATVVRALNGGDEALALLRAERALRGRLS